MVVLRRTSTLRYLQPPLYFLIAVLSDCRPFGSPSFRLTVLSACRTFGSPYFRLDYIAIILAIAVLSARCSLPRSQRLLCQDLRGHFSLALEGYFAVLCVASVPRSQQLLCSALTGYCPAILTTTSPRSALLLCRALNGFFAKH